MTDPSSSAPTSTAPGAPPGPALRRRLPPILALAALLALMASVAFAFAMPWLPKPPPGGPALARYAPVRDGDARLLARLGPDGTLLGWESQNRAVVSWLRLFGDIRPELSTALMRTHGVGQTGRPLQADLRMLQATSQVVRLNARQVDLDGRVTTSAGVFARGERGDLLIGFEQGDPSRSILLDPPIPFLPTDLAARPRAPRPRRRPALRRRHHALASTGGRHPQYPRPHPPRPPVERVP